MGRRSFPAVRPLEPSSPAAPYGDRFGGFRSRFSSPDLGQRAGVEPAFYGRPKAKLMPRRHPCTALRCSPGEALNKPHYVATPKMYHNPLKSRVESHDSRSN